MAISVSAAVARWTAAIAQSGSTASASFTPANNSLLVACVSWDENPVAATHTVSGGSLVWTQRVERNGDDAGATSSGAAIWTAQVGTGASMTVTTARSSGGDGYERRYSTKVYVVTGQHTTNPIGTNGEGSSTTNNLSPTLFTATGAGRAFYCGTDWNALGAPASTDSADAAHYAGEISVVSVYKASDHTSGSITGNLDASGTSAADWNWVALEILADAGPATTSLPPHVTAPYRTHFLMR